MTRPRSVTRWLAFGLVLSLVGLVSQSTTSAQAPLAATRQSADQGDIAAQETVDVSRLPLNLDRIQRELHRFAIREERQGPEPPLRPEANLVYGPVPYSAPTHREMIEHVTPKEYRAPAADFSALLRWLWDRAR